MRTTTPTRITGTTRAALALGVMLVLPACSGNGGPHPSGTLETTVVDVAPLISGRVLDVRADEGDSVSRGDTLIVLDTDVLRLQRDRTAANRATITAQRAQAEDMLKLAQHKQELAVSTLKRVEALVAQGSATRQQLDEATTQPDVAASEVASAHDQLAVLAAQETELASSLAVIDRQLDDGVVLSPIAGTVLLRAARTRGGGTPGALGLRLADLASLESARLPGGARPRPGEAGAELPVTVDALPGRTFDRTVTWISDEAEFTPKNAQTRDARAQLVYAVKLRVDQSRRTAAHRHAGGGGLRCRPGSEARWPTTSTSRGRPVTRCAPSRSCLDKSYGDTVAVRGSRSRRSGRGEIVGTDRPRRRRQDHDDAHPARPVARRRRARRACWAATVRARPRAVKEHVGLHAPALQPVSRPHRRREPALLRRPLSACRGTSAHRRERELMEFSRLGPFRARRAGQLSGGMKQKLALSCTLMHTPRGADPRRAHHRRRPGEPPGVLAHPARARRRRAWRSWSARRTWTRPSSATASC